MNFITCEELISKLEENKYIVIDCRFDLMNKSYGKESYEKNHIVGSFRLDMEDDLTSEVKEHGGRHPFPDLEILKIKLDNIGINNDSEIVLYDDGEIAGAGRAWSLLKYMGHEKVYVLDGGIKEYIRNGGKVSSEVNVDVEASNYEVNVNKDYICDVNYIKEAIKNNKSLIIDSREYKRYIGEFEPIDKIAGHIPTAVNYFYGDVLKNNEFGNPVMKSKEELKKHFKEIDGYDEVILYCGSGITATVNSIALAEIGLKHKIYAGSYSDWVSYKENTVDTL
ncbi:sulfurtransferase [Romboutsia weinsteinii]|uniref:Sulfurtransferase n=1 Tax=Romboutsia weinsteinii TaxID=2020949 RepID=A0A371IXS2_9FIRM|nr:sulfurtransferase [Romboutsia weinsteinii]RDY25266.1 sulfurtransferase [Romboutsia weinsteinii]